MAGGDRELVVGPDEAGERLDVFLARDAGSRAAAQRLIEAGLVRVDGAARPKRHVVAAGERIAVSPAPEAPQAAVPDATFDVAYQDEHLLVVDKPAGVVVHPARGHRAGTLAQALHGVAGGGDDPDRPGIVHRLDRETSGLMVVARTAPAYDALVDALAAREVTREYDALVWGHPENPRGVIDAPIGRSTTRRTRMAVRAEGKDARTVYEVEEWFGRPEVARLRCRLETGRTHQIRVHLSAIGHPVVGDGAYGGRRAGIELDRPFLHAEHLALAHPVTGEPLEFRSPLPSELDEVLVHLRA
jgi:23S rRNA pseudouridine1911/1915/1917 synthase